MPLTLELNTKRKVYNINALTTLTSIIISGEGINIRANLTKNNLVKYRNYFIKRAKY